MTNFEQASGASIRARIIEALVELRPDQTEALYAIDDNVDLFKAGLLDSLGFLHLMMMLEESQNREIDWSALSSGKTTISRLVQLAQPTVSC